MPWEIRQTNGRFCIFKDGETTPIEGGCHDTREAAQRQLTALNIEYYGDDAMRAVPARYRDIDFSPPQSVRDAARVGLNLHEDGHSGDGLEPTTVLWANRIARGEDISPERAKQGYRFFARNERFLDADRETPAYTSAMLWFGRPGMSWFNSLWQQMEAADADAGVKAVVAIKAANGEWQLDVLGVPFGSPAERDAHGEFFSEKTQFYAEKIPHPPVVYYHGFTPDGKPQSAPEFIGQTTQRWTDQRGVWYRVVLDQANVFAKRVWEAAQQGLARASSGTMEHLRRVARDGHITHWLVSELSLFDIGQGRQPANRYAVAVPAAKALYSRAGLPLPTEVFMGDENNTTPPQQGGLLQNATGQYVLTPEQLQQALNQAAQQAHEATAAIAQQYAPRPFDGTTVNDSIHNSVKGILEQYGVRQEQSEIAQLRGDVKALTDAMKQMQTEQRRLPMGDGGAPMLNLKTGDIKKYDHLDASDQLTLCALFTGKHNGVNIPRVSQAALKAAAMKCEADKSEVGAIGQSAMKAAGVSVKTGEVMVEADGSDYGADWVSTAFSTMLWREIRLNAFVAQMVPSLEFPPGANTMEMPLEGQDPVFYRVAEAADTDYNATSGQINATIPVSNPKAGKRIMTLDKMGARTQHSGELEEDSIIPFLRDLRLQLVESGAQQLDWVILDGDTTTSGTNINTNTTADAASVYTMVDGMRKIALATSGMNRDNNGGFDFDVFHLTAKLLGPRSIGAITSDQVGTIVPPVIWWELVKKIQVPRADYPMLTGATINGNRINIPGYTPIYGSDNFLRADADNLCRSDNGYIDSGTPANNTHGAVLCVRWDQWRMGWRRRMTIETTRTPRSDTTEIVALMRFGLAYRKATSAAAITYGIALGS
jgi:hypothetical protein